MKLIAAIIITAVIMLVLFLSINKTETDQPIETTKEHLYVSWDTMEFDKCVSHWLITRFIDKDAKFVLYPQGTEITGGIAFDVPGADWSRKHLKCTSMCILESMDINDPAIEKIVKMAGQIELNFWQLDRWGDTQKVFYEIQNIIEQTKEPMETFERTAEFFDRLYKKIQHQKPLLNTPVHDL